MIILSENPKLPLPTRDDSPPHRKAPNCRLHNISKVQETLSQCLLSSKPEAKLLPNKCERIEFYLHRIINILPVVYPVAITLF